MEQPDIVYTDNVEVNQGLWGTVLTFRVGDEIQSQVGMDSGLLRAIMWQLRRELEN